MAIVIVVPLLGTSVVIGLIFVIVWIWLKKRQRSHDHVDSGESWLTLIMLTSRC